MVAMAAVVVVVAAAAAVAGAASAAATTTAAALKEAYIQSDCELFLPNENAGCLNRHRPIFTVCVLSGTVLMNLECDVSTALLCDNTPSCNHWAESSDERQQ